ncbi:hypothetical protein FOL47_004784 [Perkinsus chesapeaki]|uniref:NADP-dependent oxidoreductase domain-containing protein n=1 Tax=Perkinsus chesapeaki TaxID=330153 RepID=A0A7J6M251_PERCH|nr:hypothetical protein FOL47_004784 [Perkinsus chesapeaki]
MPVIGLGTFMSRGFEVEEAVYNAILVGYRHIDTADLALARAINESLVNRSEVFLVSKLWPTHYRQDLVRQRVDRILNDLNVEYLDQLLLHMPEAWEYRENNDKSANFFPTTAEGLTAVNKSHNIMETWRVLESLYDEGKDGADGPFIISLVTIFLSGIHRMCNTLSRIFRVQRLKDLGELHYQKVESLQAFGFSNRKYEHDGALPDVLGHAVVRAIAGKYGKTSAQVVIRWAIQRGTVVIPKSVKKGRIEENINVFDFELSPADMVEIDAIGVDPVRIFTLPFAADGRSIFDETLPDDEL